MPYDAIVVGGGPAGLSAATWLARYRRQTLLIDAGQHRNRKVERSHGYFSRDGVSPKDLLAAGRRDLDAYDCTEIVEGEVVEVTGSIGQFVVRTADGRQWTSLRVVLCTGVVDAFPSIEGFDEHYGASIFHCAACDGFEARDRDIVVLGWGEHVAGFALELLDWARSITVITEGATLEVPGQHREALAEHGVDVIERKAVALAGTRGDLIGVRLDDGREIPCQMAFFSIAHHPRDELAAALGCRTAEAGCVDVDEHGETSVPGVYAAGDLVPGYQLIQVAAAKGTTAGVGCARSLRREAPLPGNPERAPDIDEVLDDT